MLDVPYENLVYYLYVLGEYKYREFTIVKRRGGERVLYEPRPGLKAIQQKLVQVLEAVYRPRPSVQGFVKNRSIATNAQLHESPSFVLNLDLKDFFPSINFGRVRGMFMAAPYSLPEGVATVIAQICCHGNHLPQGAPTSPIVANMICSRMDSALQKFARRHRCLFSRYADDITLSTKRERFPKNAAMVDSLSGQLTISPALESIVVHNGFEINYDKVRLRGRASRQEVTGLIVNKEANVPRGLVRQVRAMLHAWRRFGLDNAQAEFFRRYDRKSRAKFKERPTFSQVVKGKIDYIAMVKGKDSSVYRSLITQYAFLNPEYRRRPLHLETPNHLHRYRDGIWVLECDESMSQGTAFTLKGVGLITCHHVLGPQTVAFRSDRPDIKYRVRVIRQSRDFDLAILHLDAPRSYEFEPLIGREAVVGDVITVAGYPNWSPGSSLWQVQGHIAGRHTYFRQACYRISCAIVTGASGAPVFDGYRRVVGVAARGTSTVEEGEQSVEHGVIPISRVLELFGDLGE